MNDLSDTRRMVLSLPGKELGTAKGKATFSWRKFYKSYMEIILGSLSLVIALIIWQVISYKEIIDPLFISSPLAIIKDFGKAITEPSFWNHMKVSGYEFFVGFLISLLIAIPLGIITGWNKTVYALTSPFINILYVTPRLALMPIFVIIFGIGPKSKIAMVILMAIFPMILNAQKAMQIVDVEFKRAARSFNASSWQIFWTISLPFSVPLILTGIRLGVGLGLIGVVVGELFASTAGIGFMLTTAGQTLNADRMFVGVSVFAIAGILLSSLIGMIEKRFSSWRPE